MIDLSNMLIQSYINSFGRNAMAGIGSSTKLEGSAGDRLIQAAVLQHPALCPFICGDAALFPC